MMININNLWITYPDGTNAIRDLTLHIKENESVAIIGANGAGKSTLLLSWLGIIPISSGTIEINGIEVTKNHLSQICSQVGLLFQNPDDQLFMPTIYDDIAFGPRNYGLSEKQVEKRVSEVLAALNAEHLRDRMPHKLSGGEKRVAALGSVLVMHPSVMLLDEPSSFLDPKARRNIIEILSKLSLTKVIATHDLDMALDLCERVIALKEGELFADGKAEEVLLNEELMEACGLELPLSAAKRRK